MARSMPVPRLLMAAHHFAEKHVAANSEPNEETFWQEWDAFTKRNEHRLLDADLRIICAYARAALHYDTRKRFWMKASGELIPIQHEAVDMPRGMWAGRNQGNIAVDVNTGVAA